MTPAKALALLKREGVMTLVPAPGRRSLVEEVTGGPIKGSWWGHPQGGDIYKLATALEESAEVLVGKLVAGKVAFVHRALWPALYRVVTDAGWRRRAGKGLDAASRKLLAAVEKGGEVRLGAAERAARVPLEKRALVHSRSEHTDSGAHAAVLVSWRAWASDEVKDSAAGLGLDDALATLERAGITW